MIKKIMLYGIIFFCPWFKAFSFLGEEEQKELEKIKKKMELISYFSESEKKREISLYAFGERHNDWPFIKWRGDILSSLINLYLKASLPVRILDEAYPSKEYENFKYLEDNLFIHISKEADLSLLKIGTWESYEDVLEKGGLKDKITFIYEKVLNKSADDESLCKELSTYLKLQNDFVREANDRRNYSLVQEAEKLIIENPMGLNILLAGSDHLSIMNKFSSSLFKNKKIKIITPKKGIQMDNLYDGMDDLPQSGNWFWIGEILFKLAERKKTCLISEFIEIAPHKVLSLIERNILDCQEKYGLKISLKERLVLSSKNQNELNEIYRICP